MTDLMQRHPLVSLMLVWGALLFTVWCLPGDTPPFIVNLAHASLGPCQ